MSTGGGWDVPDLMTTLTGTTTTWQPSTTFHYRWNGCGCGTSVIHVGCSTHEHDYQQAQGEYRHTLYCRTCGDTKTLKPPKAKKETE